MKTMARKDEQTYCDFCGKERPIRGVLDILDYGVFGDAGILSTVHLCDDCLLGLAKEYKQKKRYGKLMHDIIGKSH